MLHNQNIPNQFNALLHAKALMEKPSITPSDHGCQHYLINQLSKLGFNCESHSINGVSNLVARWGTGSRHVAFAGHTDVVPPGLVERWHYDPFVPSVDNDVLYGRGAADMKTGIAAMLAACERTLSSLPSSEITLWWLITSDEEGEAEYGSQWIQTYLERLGIELECVLVGEPTAHIRTGDCIKVGRRGSLSAEINIRGKQGHVAYPEQTLNAVHQAAKLIQRIENYHWDQGTEDFPGTGFQVTGVSSGDVVDNLVPGQCTVSFNVRYSHNYSEQTLKKLLVSLAKETLGDHSCTIEWSRPCEAYFSQPRQTPNCLIRICEQAIHRATGQYPVMSAAGGTSDGRFFANDYTQVVELGVPNHSIHQVNEHVHLSDLATLEDIYADIVKTWLE